ncbi:hypothetical protein GGI04_006182, partial [Coemansia thaxteri]
MSFLNEAKLEERRAAIYSALKGHGEPMGFYMFMDMLGLSESFDSFCENYPSLFQSLAASAPAYVDKKMVNTSRVAAARDESASKFAGSEFFSQVNEKAVTSYFLRLVDLMDDACMDEAAGQDGTPSGGSIPYRNLYRIGDHQSRIIPGSLSHKADVVFYYPYTPLNMTSVHLVLEAKCDQIAGEIGERTLKQLADYQNSVWRAQPTRTFVPVFLLHGAALEVVVFTRNK